MSWPDLRRRGPIYVWITALFADGTESPTPAEPVKLESPEVEAFYRKHDGTGARWEVVMTARTLATRWLPGALLVCALCTACG